MSRATTVTSCSSTMARTRRPAWAAPIRRWCRPAGPAQGDGALLVGRVVAQAEVARGAAARRVRLGPRGRPRRGGARSRGAAGARCRRTGSGRAGPAARPGSAPRGWRPSQRLRVWWKRSTLPWVWGCPGIAVLLADAEVREQVLEAVAAADEARGVHGPVVGERGGGPAVRVARCGEGRDHVVAAHAPERPCTRAGSGSGRRASSTISTSLPSASRQWVKSACQTSLGAAASNRIQELRGRLCGSGTTRPAAWSDPADRRDRRHRQAFAPEVPGDRHRSRVKATGGQLPTEGDDPVADRVRRVARVGKGSAGTWLESVQPAVAVAAEQASGAAAG